MSIALPIIALLLASVPARELRAQAYPAKPIRFVVPVVAGGSPDIFARLVGERLRERWGQPVLIENRPGAGQMIGAEVVAKAPPDGYTLLIPTGTYTSSVALQRKPPFDPVNDLTGVALIGDGPLVVTIHPSLPAKNLKELIALARARPGEIHYASAGSGSIIHFASEMFASAAKINIVHVPYKSGVPALVDAVGGHVQLIITTIAALGPHVKTGRMRALAITSPKRSLFAPELPPVSDVLPGYAASQWWGVLAPAKTPPEIVARLNTEINRILGAEEMKPRLAEQGAEFTLMSAEAYSRYVRDEIVKWRRIVSERGLAG